MMHCLPTAIVLAIVLASIVCDARLILRDLAAYRRHLSPYLPAQVRRLLWLQYAWIGFPFRLAFSLLFLLAMAFFLACHLARLLMSA